MRLDDRDRGVGGPPATRDLARGTGQPLVRFVIFA
jgi:hypothetical protein